MCLVQLKPELPCALRVLCPSFSPLQKLLEYEEYRRMTPDQKIALLERGECPEGAGLAAAERLAAGERPRSHRSWRFQAVRAGWLCE